MAKIQSWNGKLLSQGGKEILWKVVALVVLAFVISCFKLPLTLCTKLESLIQNFWWGQTKEVKKIHWIGWRNICKSNFHGGLGFKELYSFNLSLLTKQGWRIIQDESSLLH